MISPAYELATRLAGDEELALAYPKGVARFVQEFQTRRVAIYRVEQRWPQAEFWQSRQALFQFAP